jgi:hypothetical protein
VHLVEDTRLGPALVTLINIDSPGFRLTNRCGRCPATRWAASVGQCAAVQMGDAGHTVTAMVRPAQRQSPGAVHV